jgi:hypothetical protein
MQTVESLGSNVVLSTVHKLMGVRVLTVGAASALSLIMVASLASSGSATTTLESTSNLLESMTLNNENRVVADVNGTKIRENTLKVHVATAELMGVGGNSELEILQTLVDDALIAQAAKAHGITVASWEVTAAIHAGILGPLSDPRTDAEVRRFVGVLLHLHDVSLEGASTDPELRAAYEGMILRGRYLQQIKASRAEVIGGLRAGASIVITLVDD